MNKTKNIKIEDENKEIKKIEKERDLNRAIRSIRRIKRKEWEKEKEKYEKIKEKGEIKSDMKYIEIKELRGVRCCKQCGCIRNRDTAAALNILHIYRYQCEHLSTSSNKSVTEVGSIAITQLCYQVTLRPDRFAYPTKQSQRPQ